MPNHKENICRGALKDKITQRIQKVENLTDHKNTKLPADWLLKFYRNSETIMTLVARDMIPHSSVMEYLENESDKIWENGRPHLVRAYQSGPKKYNAHSTSHFTKTSNLEALKVVQKAAYEYHCRAKQAGQPCPAHIPLDEWNAL